MGAAHEQALSDLRAYLIRGLSRALGGRGGVDENFVEDAAQETLLKVLDRLTQFQGRSRFTTWVMSIAVRVAYTELRRRCWKDVSLESVVDEVGALETGPDEGATDRAAVVSEMYRVIREDLTAKQREALLAELAGMPQEEIGRRTGSNRNAVYKLTHDARRRLKRGLEAKGYTGQDVRGVFGW